MHRLLIMPLIMLAGCASTDSGPTTQWTTTYYDRNHDGRVDFELHRLGSGGADADWALSDTRFRGRYDRRLKWGFVFQRQQIDLPVPTDVLITPGDPPVSTTR